MQTGPILRRKRLGCASMPSVNVAASPRLAWPVTVTSRRHLYIRRPRTRWVTRLQKIRRPAHFRSDGDKSCERSRTARIRGLKLVPFVCRTDARQARNSRTAERPASPGRRQVTLHSKPTGSAAPVHAFVRRCVNDQDPPTEIVGSLAHFSLRDPF